MHTDPPSSSGSVPIPTHSGKPPVLVVEDDRSTRILLDCVLKDFCTPTVVGTKREALQAIADCSFDLFLIDINLQQKSAPLGPERAGVKLLHAIRKQDPVANFVSNGARGDASSGSDSAGRVSAVAVTAYALPGDREWLLGEGFDAYVEKPFAMRQLREAVSGALSGGALQGSGVSPNP